MALLWKLAAVKFEFKALCCPAMWLVSGINWDWFLSIVGMFQDEHDGGNKC